MAEESGDPVHETTLHVARARAGDDASREWLAGHLYPLVLAHAHVRLRHHPVGDTTPEAAAGFVMMTLLSRLDDVQPRDGRVGPVIRTFLRSTLIQHLSNARRSRRRDRLGSAPVPWGDPSSGPADDTSGIITGLGRSERSSAVLQVLGALAVEDREVLIARFWEEEDWGAIAARTGINATALRKRGERALARVARALPTSIVEEFLTGSG